MARPVNKTPLLPRASGSPDPATMSRFDADLSRALFAELSAHAFRINGSLQKDGSEPMTGDLDMAGYAILNADLSGAGLGTAAFEDIPFDATDTDFITGLFDTPFLPILIAGGDTSTDFDTITTPGWHNRIMQGNNPNGPTGASGSWHFIQVRQYAGGQLVQIAYPYAAGAAHIGGNTAGHHSIWMRSRDNSVWGAWFEIGINKARLDTLYVPTTRTVTAGTGMSGGGQLDANITLNVTFGTTAGTAAQGNDSRIVTANAAITGRLGLNAAIITDWDDALQNGWYRSSSTTTDLNAPETGIWFVGFVERLSVNWITQTLHRTVSANASDTRTWRRNYLNGTWTSWYRLRLSEEEQSALYLRLDGGTTTGAVDNAWHNYGGTNAGHITLNPANGLVGLINRNGGSNNINAPANATGVAYTMLIRIQGTSNTGSPSLVGFTNTDFGDDLPGTGQWAWLHVVVAGAIKSAKIEAINY